MKLSKSTRAILTFLLFAMLFAYGVTFYLSFRLLGTIGEFFEVGPSKTALFVLLLGIGMISGLLWGGYVSDRISGKLVLVLSLLFLAAGCFGVGLRLSLPLCLVGIFVAGIGLGALQSSANALLFSAYSKKRVFIANWLHIFAALGGSASPWIAGSFIEGRNWHIPYVLISTFAILILLMFGLISSKLSVIREKLDFSAVRELARNRLLIMLYTGAVLYTASEIGIASWMSSFLENERAFGVNEASLGLSIYWLMMIPSRIVVAWLSLRKPAAMVLVGCVLVSIIGFGLFILAGDSLVILAGIILMGLGFGPLFPTLLGLAVDSVGRFAGTISGLYIMFAVASGSLFSYLMGVMSEYTDYRTVMLISVIPVACMLPLLMRVWRKDQPAPARNGC